jgi:hypothetical protein
MLKCENQVNEKYTVNALEKCRRPGVHEILGPRKSSRGSKKALLFLNP